MTPKIKSTETEKTPSLGELLKNRRAERGIDLAAVAADTRISPRILEAMENGDYSCLPADAFTRGFYNLYARLLELDPKEILRMYSRESKGHPNLVSNAGYLPGAGESEVLEFAERPRILHFSTLGFFLMVLLLFGAFLCWYFSWNPATFLSQKLRSYQQESQQVEKSREVPEKKPEKVPLFHIVKVVPRQRTAADDFPIHDLLDPVHHNPTHRERVGLQ
jgi:cytoskeleton protein RodZ